MKVFSLKLRKILLSDLFFILLLSLTIIYLIIYQLLFDVSHIYNYNSKEFNLIIKNYYIDGDKLTLELDNLIGTYYFKSKNELNTFNKNYSLGDTISITGTLTIPNNNTIPNTYNYKKY